MLHLLLGLALTFVPSLLLPTDQVSISPSTDSLVQTEDYLLAGFGNNLGLASSQGAFVTAFSQVGQIVPSQPCVCQPSGNDSFCAHTDESQRLSCILKKI